MEIDNIFKNKTEEEGVGVTDLINRIIQVLKVNLYWFRISVQETGLLKPAKSGDKE